MATRIDGKALAAKVKAQTAEAAKSLYRRPGLAVILVGNDPASRVYVTGKEKDCAECGFLSFEHALPEDTTQETLLDLIQELNRDPQVDGILCQLPLPGHLDEEAVLNAIARAKDVDCFHPSNGGRLMIGDPVFLPCTPAGVMDMLLLQQDGTVTVCHSKTPGLAAITREADILVSAVGRVGLVTPGMVKEGAVVIDVAMNRNSEGRLCGDVDFAAVEPKASYITPVPGGVGPMTRAMLMRNILTAARNHQAEK